ncbi:MAG: YgjV family protein [Idiomarina sp.]|nr:YgjV family protein [Idiomarina sp.]
MDYALYLFGALALIFNFIGYRQNTINRYRLVSAFALAFLSAHFFLLGAMAAGISLALGAVRNIVAMKYRQRWILYLFVLLNVGFCLWEYLIVGNSALLFVAYASALVFTVGSIVLESAASIRRWFILAELLGLVYAIAVGSIFGILFNISNLTSIITKMLSERKSKAVESARKM